MVLGAVLGSLLQWAIDKYFTKSFNNTTELAGFLKQKRQIKMIEFVTGQGIQLELMVVQQSNFNGIPIWLAFAIYALVIAVAFAVFVQAQNTILRC
jgi:NHS family xanthosine MFS transporter